MRSVTSRTLQLTALVTLASACGASGADSGGGGSGGLGGVSVIAGSAGAVTAGGATSTGAGGAGAHAGAVAMGGENSAGMGGASHPEDFVTLEPDDGSDWNAQPHPLVFVGHADPWEALNDHAADWTYVERNADGLYVNFIVTDLVWKTSAAIVAGLKPTAALMRNKHLFYEADQKDGTRANDQRNLDAFSTAGLETDYATYNYTIDPAYGGWDTARADTLRSYGLGPNQKPRPALVLLGPWTLGGDITTSGEAQRQLDTLADGFSTDGPLGYWVADRNGYRAASYSLVEHGKKIDKFGGVMLAPYDPPDVPTSVYDYTAQFLSASIDNVLDVEAESGSPSAWLIWEYAVTLPATPESKADGSPVNSTTGVAYWLLHHLKGEDAELKLSAKAESQDATLVSFVLSNDSTWCPLIPALHARIVGSSANWAVSIRIDGVDASTAALSNAGFAFTGAQSLTPKATHAVDVAMTCASCTGSAADAPRPAIRLELWGHRDVPKPVRVWTIR